jgi:hypothetical protein
MSSGLPTTPSPYRLASWNLLEQIKKTLEETLILNGLEIVPLHRNGTSDRELSYDNVVLAVQVQGMNFIEFDIIWPTSRPGIGGGVHFIIAENDPLRVRLATQEYVAVLQKYSEAFFQCCSHASSKLEDIFPDLAAHGRPRLIDWNTRSQIN